MNTPDVQQAHQALRGRTINRRRKIEAPSNEQANQDNNEKETRRDESESRSRSRRRVPSYDKDISLNEYIERNRKPNKARVTMMQDIIGDNGMVIDTIELNTYYTFLPGEGASEDGEPKDYDNRN